MEELDQNVPLLTNTNEVRFLNYDNTWNIDGLLASRTDDDGEVIECSKTGEPLFFFREDGTKIMLQTHGDCYNCGNTFHEGALAISDGVSRSSYPVCYDGRWRVRS
jgi:hypothetical protein